MRRRGRPRYPDILTPREQEVLALIREQLSNEEIAAQLGISVQGVKYHVSEILGKLGLENRSDAARWQAEQGRPRWQAALAPLAFWRAPSRIAAGISTVLAVGLVAGIGLFVWALTTTEDEGPVDVAMLTPERFAGQLRQTLAREGDVFHTTAEFVTEDVNGEAQRSYTMETWLGPGERSRHEFRKDPSWDADVADHTTSVIVGDTAYMNDDVEVWTSPVQPCEGIMEVLNIFLPSGCSEPAPDGDEMGLETGLDYEGTTALALTSTTTSTSEELGRIETRNGSVRFYFNASSLAPLAWVLESRSEDGQLEGTVRLTFNNDYVEAGDLPDDFFDPTSIGYVAPTPTNTNPAAELDEPDLGVAVYWLGRAFVPGGNLPPMRLVQSGRGGEGPGYRVLLTYRLEDSDTDVAVWLWEPDAWQKYRDAVIPRTSFASSCARQEEIALDGGNAIIYMSHEPERPPGPATTEPVTPPPPGATLVADVTPTPAPTARPAGQDSASCPDRPFDLFMAVVDFGGTIVTVNLPHCTVCSGRGFDPDPYDSREGMEAILRGLREREPGE